MGPADFIARPRLRETSRRRHVAVGVEVEAVLGNGLLIVAAVVMVLGQQRLHAGLENPVLAAVDGLAVGAHGALPVSRFCIDFGQADIRLRDQALFLGKGGDHFAIGLCRGLRVAIAGVAVAYFDLRLGRQFDGRLVD